MSEITKKILEVLDSHPEITTIEEATKLAFPDQDVVITLVPTQETQ